MILFATPRYNYFHYSITIESKRQCQAKQPQFDELKQHMWPYEHAPLLPKYLSALPVISACSQATKFLEMQGGPLVS